VHHEVELAVVVDCLARRVPEAQALEHVGGYALAIDLTARDLQEEAKKVCEREKRGVRRYGHTCSAMD